MKGLKGYKTYIFAGLGAIASFAMYMGWIDRSLFEAIAGFLGFGSLVALRAGVKKLS